MPNSVTIVSPVSGETILAADVLNLSVDYEYVYSNQRYVGGNCSTGGGHAGYAGPIGTEGSLEIGLGTHSGNYSGVELTARIQDSITWGSALVAQATVNNITITDTPPIVIDPMAPPPPMPYFRIGQSTAAEKNVTDCWPLEYGRAFNPQTDLTVLDRVYDPMVDLKLTGKIKDPAYYSGSVVGVVNGKVGKTGLVTVYTLKNADVTINPGTGVWEVTIPKKVLKKGNAPRQLILTLLDDKEEFVATVSAPLMKQRP